MYVCVYVCRDKVEILLVVVEFVQILFLIF